MINITSAGRESPPPPPPDVAQNDLMMRLGLLLGERMNSQIAERPHGRHHAGPLPPGAGSQTDLPYTAGQASHPGSLPLHMANQTEQSCNSISSLSSSNDNTPEKGLSDTSPMSTLTGTLFILCVYVFVRWHKLS